MGTEPATAGLKATTLYKFDIRRNVYCNSFNKKRNAHFCDTGTPKKIIFNYNVNLIIQ